MVERLRILFTIPNFITAGSGRALLNIVERLDKDKFAPAVCVMRKGGSLDKEVEAMGIPFIEAPFTVPARPYSTLPFRAWRAARMFRPYHFDLWHSFNYADDYTEPIIARLSGGRAWVYTKKNMNWRRRSWHLRTLLATRIAALNTDMMQEFFSHRLSSAKTYLIPRGIDIRRYRPNTASGLPIRERLDIDSGAIVVGCVAQLVPVKGHPTLLRAISQVPDVKLLIAGAPLDQEYSGSLGVLCGDLGIEGRVVLLGSVTDVPGFLSELDIFVLPTCAPGEGCPVALLEAMAAGKACIATDIPGSRDLIQDERNGLLVPSEDPRALADAIRKLSSSPELRCKLGAAARATVEEQFSIEREVVNHEQLYEEIFGKVKRNGVPASGVEISREALR
ncbi:MAG: glycosyltransferase [Pyrinomonadaceae bacterium]